MAVKLSHKLQQFLSEVFPAVVGTKRRDGTTQLNPVWFEVGDNGDIWLNSGRDRRWQAHLQRDKEVTLLFVDPKNMFRWAQVQGRLVEATTQSADEHIDRLSLRYTGNPKYQNPNPGEQRIKLKIEPLRITGWDGWNSWE